MSSLAKIDLFIETSGRGPDVVLLHGWGLHGDVFARVAERLEHEFTVHRVDLPGHGHTPLDGCSGPADAAARLAATFPLPVQVVGWSLGGLVGQYWAAQAPEQVKSLALVSTSPRFVQSEDWPHAQTRAAIEAVGASLANDFAGTLERFLGLQMLGAPHARETLKAIKELLFAHGRPEGLEAALGWLLDSDARPLAQDIRCPVALLYGVRDMITPQGASRWLAEALADARLEAFEQASHAPFLSHEEDFSARLQRFLQATA
jgi:pimeloyl-[acyl-carrier protein] methyl ester esterase